MTKVTVALLLMAGSLAVQAQSLGELARQARAKKEMAPKAKRVFTNETLPRDATISSVGAAPTPPPAANAAAPSGAGAPKEGAKPSTASGDEEAAYKAKYAKLKDDLSTEERRLDVLQRELNLAQQQVYSDPNVALREQFTRNELTKRTQEIDQQKQNVEKVKQAIAALQEEVRKKGLPAGWVQ